jgi:hypothetical protein
MSYTKYYKIIHESLLIYNDFNRIYLIHNSILLNYIYEYIFIVIFIKYYISSHCVKCDKNQMNVLYHYHILKNVLFIKTYNFL